MIIIKNLTKIQLVLTTKLYVFHRTKKYELFVNIIPELRHGRVFFCSYDEKFLRSFAKDTFLGRECIKFILQQETLIEFSFFCEKFSSVDMLDNYIVLFSRKRENSYFVN